VSQLSAVQSFVRTAAKVLFPPFVAKYCTVAIGNMGSLLPFAAPSTKVRNGPLAPHLVEGRTATLSAQQRFVQTAAKVRSPPLTSKCAWCSIGHKRPKPAVHSLDQMTLHRSDSGHSFQVQLSHGREGRFIARIQT
jgi:hypothetical protein